MVAVNTTLRGVVPGIIDAHIHQWDPLSTPRRSTPMAELYARSPDEANLVFEQHLPRASREALITPEHVFAPYLPNHYAIDVAGADAAVDVPVLAAIHVEADWHSDDPSEETAWLDTLGWGTDGRPELAAILGHADPRDGDFARRLDAHLSASPRFRGIRTVAIWHADPEVESGSGEVGILRSPPFLKGFAALAERGLTFDAYLYADQIPDLLVLAREYPETTIVLDHYAPPVGVFGPMGEGTGHTAGDRADILARWRDGIASLAECPNVIAKHSGLGFPMLGNRELHAGRAALAELVRPLVDHVTDTFGDDRLVFGSNFPMDKAVARYGDLVGALADLLAPRGEATLRKVFHDNAKRIYRLDDL